MHRETGSRSGRTNKVNASESGADVIRQSGSDIYLFLMHAGFLCTIRRIRALYIVSLLFIAGCHDDVKFDDVGTYTPADRPELNATPNVVFVLVDDLGWMDLGSYGSDFYDTPSMDNLTETAVRFTNAYSASPLCSPTRASILTGQDVGRLRFTMPVGDARTQPVNLNPVETNTSLVTAKATDPQSINRLPNTYLTFAEVLKQHGYATAFMGKWHMGVEPYIPENQGFDMVVGGRNNAAPPPPGHYFSPWDVDTLPKVPEGKHIGDVLTDSAIEFIEDHQTNPFLLCLWYYDVHGPLQGKAATIEKYETKLDELTRQHANPRQRNPVMGAMIDTLDSNIARLLDTLYALKMDTRTVVILTSDNGGNMYDIEAGMTSTNNAPLRGGKGINYEGGTRVPLIVRAPGVSVPGTTSDVVVSSQDHYASILELLHIPFPADLVTDGVSYVPALRGEIHERPPAFFSFPFNVPSTGNRPNVAVRSGPWKFYKFYYDGINTEHRYELYDLENDIGEQTNVVDDYPEVAEQMLTALEAHVTEAGYLQSRLNKNYVGNVAGPWHGSDNTALSIANHVLSIQSTSAGPYIETRYFPVVVDDDYLIEFEMTSESGGNGQIQWMYTSDKQLRAENKVSFVPQHDGKWHRYSVLIHLEEPVLLLRIQPSDAAGALEIRNFQLSSADGHMLRQWPLY